MARMSSAEYNAYLARRHGQAFKPDSAVLNEAKLHEDILAECRRRGWLVFHGSMAHRTFRTPGEPDFVILRDNGKTLMVECKSGTGKLSTDQQAVAAWASKLGHQIHVVHSMEEFFKCL